MKDYNLPFNLILDIKNPPGKFPNFCPMKSSLRSTKYYSYIKHRYYPCYLDLIVLTCRYEHVGR